MSNNEVPELYRIGARLMEEFDAADFRTSEADNTVTLVWEAEISVDDINGFEGH